MSEYFYLNTLSETVSWESESNFFNVDLFDKHMEAYKGSFDFEKQTALVQDGGLSKQMILK